jgi:hypothetical protein
MLKTILVILILGSIIVLGIYYPLVWWIIGIGLIIVIALIYLFISSIDKSSELSMKEKFGENYKELIRSGKLGLRTAYSCKPDIHYTSTIEIEKLAIISLPYFTIKERKESLGDITGDYSGEAVLDFGSIVDDNIIQQIEENMKQEDSRWRKGENGEYVCDLLKPYVGKPVTDEFWTLSIHENMSEGIVRYGRV